MTAPLDQPGFQNPENRFLTPSSAESQGATPHLVNNFLISWLRIQFAHASNLQDMILRNAPTGSATDFVWRAGNTPGLVIEDVGMWLKKNQEGRPAILVKLGGWEFQSSGIGGGVHMGSGSLNPAEHFSCMFQGSHTIFCISREPGEVMRLAWEVATGLLQSAQPIRSSLCLKRFVLAKFGEIGKIKEAEDSFVIPLNLAYAGELLWTLRPEAPRFKTFDMQTT